MIISKVKLKNNRVVLGSVSLDVENEGSYTKGIVEGIGMSIDNSEIYFIVEHGYFRELVGYLEGAKEFYKVFGSGGQIGQGQGTIVASAELVKKATELNVRLESLIKKIP